MYGELTGLFGEKSSAGKALSNMKLMNEVYSSKQKPLEDRNMHQIYSDIIDMVMTNESHFRTCLKFK